MPSSLSDACDLLLVDARQLARVDSRSSLVLLQPTDFQLQGSDRVVITGPSGSGKSVLLRTLALLEAPSAGEVLWRGQPIPKAEVPRYRSRVSYLAQRPAVLEGTVEDNLRYPYSLKAFKGLEFDQARVLALLALAGKNAGFLGKPAAELSGGEAQIMALIRMLQLDPQVLLLDEPTAALDPASVTEVENLVQAWFANESGGLRAYVWVTHDPEQAQRMSSIRMGMKAGVLTQLAAS